MSLDLPSPYLLFLGDVTEAPFAKTAFGIRDWARDLCVGEHTSSPDAVSLGLPVLTPAEAAARGARSMVIGVASFGGSVAPGWVPHLLDALEAGLDLVSGMHQKLAEEPALKAAADRLGRRLIDVRMPPAGLPTATGRKRSGNRLLTVGTDCALGKKYTALALAQAFGKRGLAADFRATGQTGIIIAGGGIPMDAVVSDFLAGAAETLTPDADPDHWDVIEGQGALGHPTYAAVSLGLLHGSQPDVIVLCHQAGRSHVLGLDEQFALPDPLAAIAVNLRHARLTNPDVRCGGISLNTGHLDAEEAERVMDRMSRETRLPCADPMRGGPRFDALVTACLAE